MRNILSIGLLIFITVIGCNNDNEHLISTLMLNDTIKLGYKETKYNYENQISICLDSIISDSRCPKDAICKWAGNAEVRLLFSYNNYITIFILNTHGGDKFKTDSLISEYRIKLLNLAPYPETTSIIPQENYFAEIVIKNE